MDTGCVSQNILLAWLSGHNVRHYFGLVELVSGGLNSKWVLLCKELKRSTLRSLPRPPSTNRVPPTRQPRLPV